VIERWLTAIRDHPDRPPAMQRHALSMLALRLNWKTGAGYISTSQLMTDADASKATVMRATTWARKQGLLTQTRRGHRLGNGQIVASEWQLSQSLTSEPLTSPQGLNGHISRSQQGHLKVSPQTHHQELSPSRTSSSARTRTQSARGRRDNCAAGVHGNSCGEPTCQCECHQ
jgi:hypothetical protein